MGIGILTDAELERELQNSQTYEAQPISTSVKSTLVIHPPASLRSDSMGERGRGKGNVEVPNSLRQLIGTTAVEEGRSEALSIARDFGVSDSSVAAYTNGATSTATYEQTPNRDAIKGAKNRVSKRARAKLMLALSRLTAEKLDECKARDLSSIAKDMSQVMKNMEETDPTGKGNTLNQPVFHIFAPQMKKEDHYEIVHARE